MNLANTFPSVPFSACKKGAMALAVGAALAFGSGAASAVETTFTGYTDGCFGLNCVPTASPTASTVTLPGTGLSYSDSTFNAETAGGFLSLGSTGYQDPTSNFNNLGSLTLTGDPMSYVGKFFDLLVTFTAPSGTSPGATLFKDTITGTVASNNAGGVFINFDQSDLKHFTFGNGGSFDFFVNDVSLTAGRTIGLSGTIIAAAVPEPETYALLMAGLFAVGFMARRRKV